MAHHPGRRSERKEVEKAMPTCHCEGVEAQFGAAVARRDLRRYRRKGATGTSGGLLAALREVAVRADSLLDVGGGVGILVHEWLGSNAGSATLVEASSAYIAEARGEAVRRGHAERLRIVHGDFVELADDVEAADLVTLDRVVCCYPDLDGLVRASAARARRWYGLSYPRDRWYVKAVAAVQNRIRSFRGCSFRVFVHPEHRIERVLREAGFTASFTRGGLVWCTALYELTADTDTAVG